MGSEMTVVLWTGDPLLGVVTWGSAGLIVWSLVAALVGSILGMLRSLDARPQAKPVAPRPRPRMRQSARSDRALPARVA